MELGLIAIGAGLAVGLAAIATGIAQSRIGSAGIGAITEKEELTGRVILLLAIPETLVILGFAVAAMVILLLLLRDRSDAGRPDATLRDPGGDGGQTDGETGSDGDEPEFHSPLLSVHMTLRFA